MSGRYHINPLEPKMWNVDEGADDAQEEDDEDTPAATRISLTGTFVAIDELYLFLSNPTAIEYIRNCMKRVRKKESALLLASQNIEDFTQPGMAEMTRPLFAIPTHQFLFNAGSIDKQFYMDNIQVEVSEYDLIRQAIRGECLYKCGNERHLLEVKASAP